MKVFLAVLGWKEQAAGRGMNFGRIGGRESGRYNVAEHGSTDTTTEDHKLRRQTPKSRRGNHHRI